MRPLVLGYHLIWTAYGWWLPNDPRGSMSKFVACDALKDLGELHYGRKRIQPASRVIRQFYDDAKGCLMHELLTFDDRQRQEIANAFAQSIQAQNYTCYACAIMPDHVHLLIRKHRDPAKRMIECLQEDSAAHLRSVGCRGPSHPVWGGPGWKVFLDSPEDIRRVVHYIEENPGKGRLPSQHWGFVKPYDGWCFKSDVRPRRG